MDLLWIECDSIPVRLASDASYERYIRLYLEEKSVKTLSCFPLLPVLERLSNQAIAVHDSVPRQMIRRI